MRNFLRSTNLNILKSNLVRWEMVCLPKSEGRLGLRSVKEFYEACLLNLAWLTINADSLWANWFQARYFGGLSIWNSTNPRGGSGICKRLGSLFSILQRDSKWIVGNGRSMSLWFDNWIDLQPIAPKFPSIRFYINDLVADIIVGNAWHIPKQLPTVLQEFLLHSTRLIIIGDNTVLHSLFWPGNSTGNLPLTIAWNLLRTKAAETSWSGLNWNKFINPHLACLSWFLLHRKTSSDNWAKLRGWSNASRCHNCFSDEETDLHTFFSCNLAQLFWHWLLNPLGALLSSTLSASAIWKIIVADGEVLGR